MQIRGLLARALLDALMARGSFVGEARYRSGCWRPSDRPPRRPEDARAEVAPAGRATSQRTGVSFTTPPLSRRSEPGGGSVTRVRSRTRRVRFCESCTTNVARLAERRTTRTLTLSTPERDLACAGPLARRRAQETIACSQVRRPRTATLPKTHNAAPQSSPRLPAQGRRPRCDSRWPQATLRNSCRPLRCGR